MGTTRIDLALALAEKGEIDEAGHEGTKAFDSPFVRRSTLERASGLDRALIPHGDVAEARDFRERYRAMRASADRSRARP